MSKGAQGISPTAAALGLLGTLGPFLTLPFLAGNSTKYIGGPEPIRQIGYRTRSFRDYMGKIKSGWRSRSRRRSKKQTKRGRKRKRRTRKKTASDCDIRKLKKFMRQQQAVHVHRHRAVGVWSTASNIQKVDGIGLTRTNLEDAMKNLRFYDPGSNALVTVDAGLGTYNRDITCRISRFLQLGNNTTVPCEVEVYSCIPKNDVTNTPPTWYTNGLTDQGNPDANSTLMKPKDSAQLRLNWSCKRIMKKTMAPGTRASVAFFGKTFQYDIAMTDVHTLAYQRKYGGHFFMIRLSGKLAHDQTTSTLVGLAEARVDYKIENHYRFTYDAGKDLEDYSISDGLATMGNARQRNYQDSSFVNYNVV